MTISLIQQRVFHGTTDISREANDFRSLNYALTYTAGEYLYVGQRTPFNSLWFDLATASGSSAGTPVIKAWWGNTWENVVDIQDETNGMQASGRITWALNRLKGWDREQDSVDVGLTGTNVYDMYWLRINWPSSFTASISYIGQRFSNDTVLASFYPDLLQSNILAGYKTGKTNWNDEHFQVAEMIVKDLQSRNMIYARGQILDWVTFEEAACRKLGEIVYGCFGEAYREHVKDARRDYEAQMSKKAMTLDEDMDGHVRDLDLAARQGFMTR
jgi:hypothetical protein